MRINENSVNPIMPKCLSAVVAGRNILKYRVDRDRSTSSVDCRKNFRRSNLLYACWHVRRGARAREREKREDEGVKYARNSRLRIEVNLFERSIFISAL